MFWLVIFKMVNKFLLILMEFVHSIQKFFISWNIVMDKPWYSLLENTICNSSYGPTIFKHRQELKIRGEEK